MAESPRAKLFQYAVILHPTAKEAKDTGKRAELLRPLETILASSLEEVNMLAARSLPEDCMSKLDRVEVAVRPF